MALKFELAGPLAAKPEVGVAKYFACRRPLVVPT